MIGNELRRSREAVSPVIAIILMVAITVVLAGVLYVWVSSLADTDTTNLNFPVFNTELSAGDEVLTLEMRRGDPILWKDYRLLMNQTELDIDVLETKVGEEVFINITTADYPNITLVPAERYVLTLIDIDEESIVWEDSVICKV